MSEQTHTYVTLELSPGAFQEIKQKLQDAGYENSHFIYNNGKLTIDMYGIAVKQEYE